MEHSGEGPRPFSAVLDTGLHRTSTGSKVFACLKVCAPLGRHKGQNFRGRPQPAEELAVVLWPGCMLWLACGSWAAPSLLLIGPMLQGC